MWYGSGMQSRKPGCLAFIVSSFQPRHPSTSPWTLKALLSFALPYPLRRCQRQPWHSCPCASPPLPSQWACPSRRFLSMLRVGSSLVPQRAFFDSSLLNCFVFCLGWSPEQLSPKYEFLRWERPPQSLLQRQPWRRQLLVLSRWSCNPTMIERQRGKPSSAESDWYKSALCERRVAGLRLRWRSIKMCNAACIPHSLLSEYCLCTMARSCIVWWMSAPHVGSTCTLQASQLLHVILCGPAVLLRGVKSGDWDFQLFCVQSVCFSYSLHDSISQDQCHCLTLPLH